MINDKIDDNIYYMCMIRFIVFASCKIIMINDKIDDNIYCVWTITFIVCV
jgi:hypothetical protein